MLGILTASGRRAATFNCASKLSVCPAGSGDFLRLGDPLDATVGERFCQEGKIKNRRMVSDAR